MTHAGQGCAITTRCSCRRARYDEAVEAVAGDDGRARLRRSRPTRRNLMGPLISDRQRERVLGYIERAVAEGATVASGGGVPADLAGRRVLRRADGAHRRRRRTARSPRRRSSARCSPSSPTTATTTRSRIANDSIYGLSGAVVQRPTDERALGRRRPHPHRHDQRQRRPVLRPRRALRRLQAERHRPRDGRAGLRGVPRDEVGRHRSQAVTDHPPRSG